MPTLDGPSSPSAPRDVRHLGDFTATSRMLIIAALALPVGAASAFVAWTLLRLIGLITTAVFYHRLGTRLVAAGSGQHNPAVVLLAPVAGGLVIGLMARYGSEKIRGHGMPEAIESILLGGSRIVPRVAVLKPLSAAIAIGTGGPFGAEGPIIMTGGAVGSLFAQLLHLTADERKTLLVAGAAGGMAATFNSPFAALMLAVELLLFEWRPRSYVPVAEPSALAAVVRRRCSAPSPCFPSTGALHSPTATYATVPRLGHRLRRCSPVLATALVYAAEDAFRRLPVHWMWWPAIGGLDHRSRWARRAAGARASATTSSARARRYASRLAPRPRDPDRQDADLVALARLRAPPAACSPRRS